MANIAEVVENFEAQFGAEETLKRANDFMISYLSLMMESLPEVAREGLVVAERFRKGLATPSELTDARVKCWKFLDERSASTDFSKPEHCAIRATLCCLHAEPSEDFPDLLDWFLTLANEVQDHSAEIEGLVAQCFPMAR